MRSPYRLDAVLANRRWWWRRRPFPHVTARDVFDAPTYDQIEQAFRDMLKAQASGYLSGHDIHGRTLGPEDSGPLALFASHEWHDMLARLLGVEATGDVNCGLHHHEVGSADGFPHNDLNPGWFADYPTDDGIRLARPDLCSYTTGKPVRSGVQPRETVRAAAVLFYVDNPPWSPGEGGNTGLYSSAADPPDRPQAAVPPINNSLLAFQCTPFSYHGFISNRVSPRNSIVMWLHQPKAHAVARWGAESIVQYGQAE